MTHKKLYASLIFTKHKADYTGNNAFFAEICSRLNRWVTNIEVESITTAPAKSENVKIVVDIVCLVLPDDPRPLSDGDEVQKFLEGLLVTLPVCSINVDEERSEFIDNVPMIA